MAPKVKIEKIEDVEDVEPVSKKEKDESRKRGEKKLNEFVGSFEGVQRQVATLEETIDNMGHLIGGDLLGFLEDNTEAIHELTDEIKTLRVIMGQQTGKKHPPVDLNGIVFGKE